MVAATSGNGSFFFSSRRRHTRLQGDWSSDVCSSDLNATATTLSVPANSSTDKSSYRAVFGNPCGTNTTASASLTVGSSISCNIDGPDVLCPNSTANSFTAPGFMAYQWSVSGNATLVGSSTSSLVMLTAGSSGTA